MFVVYIIINQNTFDSITAIIGAKKRRLRKNRKRLCCLGRIRTLTGGTRIRRATITPQGKVSCHFDVAKVRTFFEPTNVFLLFFNIVLNKIEKKKKEVVTKAENNYLSRE